MRTVYPASDGEYSIADIARGSAVLAPSVRVKANDQAAEQVRGPAINGFLLANEVQPGLFATGHRATYLDDFNVEIEVGASLVCGILLGGESEPVYVEGKPIYYILDRPLLIGFGKPVRSASCWKAGQENTCAGFTLQQGFFERLGIHVADDGLSRLHDLLTSDVCSMVLPKSRRLTEIAQQNLTHPYDGRLGELFLEANTLAFVIETARLLEEAQRIAGLVGRKQYDRVMQAREILDANIADPPKSLDLARQVGVCLTTLQTSFKAAFGQSIFGYVRQQRLELSRRLLRDTELSVAEIGYRVGFSNAAAFTAAYRRQYGFPPTKEAGRR
ncbi:helix-turn-helix domain-containing protein [Hyphomicrobium sp.]|uniref:helix-turn-helix transcriptional regulator n=1 Tax=Hyphomicrobium sp. TaxID=82 RepID=UPI0025C57555|nr:helix-turn-helix domain-containing protein [Hyphomicrobium sp.]MCC7252487.1 helix-turn-helix domain-containing protein [Hyphomicrobium sp.]